MAINNVAQIGSDTKVIADRDGVVRIVPSGRNQNIRMQASERELMGVCGIDISIVPDDIIGVKLTMRARVPEITAYVNDVDYWAHDPNDHFAEKRVSQMVFDDGSMWEAD